MRFFAIIFLCFCGIFASAQKISGNIKDESGKVLLSSTALLYLDRDSSLVRTSVANNKGEYEFIAIKAGRYFLKISNVGFQDKYAATFNYDGNVFRVPLIILKKNTATLNDVVVISKKPIIVVKADKIIFNVENNINAAGLDGMELLRQAPGVMVDPEENISLAGKSGVQIFIDGKPSPLSAKDLASYLKSLRSSSIESIEVINNPSAKYEAAGTGGIINIRLIKNKNYGTNGTVNYEFKQGVWGKHNAGLSLNNRNKNFNFFTNYNFYKGTSEFDLDYYRTILDSTFNATSPSHTFGTAHNFKAGVDYVISKKSTVGILFNGNFSDDSLEVDSRTYIFYAPTKTPERTLFSNNKTKSSRNNASINLNYRYADSTGHELAIDADYGYFGLRSNQYQPNVFYDPMIQNVLYENNYGMITPADIDLYSIKADYEEDFKKGRLGFGAKVAFINSDNLFNFYNYGTNNKPQYDSALSNHFIYKENINALYVNYNKEYKNLSAQFGVRMENTVTKGNSLGYKNNNSVLNNYNEKFTRKLVDFFPSAAITFTKFPKSQWTLSYSRRINRPSYQDLNPFESRSSEYGGIKGNSSLRPEYANSLSLVHVFHNRLVTNLSFTHTKDVIASISDTLDGTKSYYFPKNLAKQDNVSLSINYSFSKAWYAFTVSSTAYYAHNLADFGAGRQVDLSVFAFSGFIQNNFTIGKGWSASLNGWYSSPTIFRGTMKTQHIQGVNAGGQKIILKGNGTLRLNFNDIFNSVHAYASSNFAGQDLHATVFWDPRNVIIGFSYKFGSNTVKDARRHTTGIDEESKRAADNNN